MDAAAMAILLQQLVNSLAISAIIIMIGIGITLVFGLTGIINFAQGELLMLGGVATWLLVGRAGVNFFAALVAAAVIVGAVGFLLERSIFRFTLRRPMNGFIISLGLSVFLQHFVIRFWNSYQKSIPDPVGGVWQVGSIRIAAVRVMVVAVTAAAVGFTFFAISRSRHGLALRAAVADQDTARLMGIPVARYVTAVFVYGSALAGLGGALMIALFPITPFVGQDVVVGGFAVALIGGLGNVAGAVVAGLILGFADGLSAGYGLPEWTEAYSFALMILILLVRPQGLLGGTEGPAIV